MTEADFKGHSGVLGGFPLASLSRLAESLKANAAFGVTLSLC